MKILTRTIAEAWALGTFQIIEKRTDLPDDRLIETLDLVIHLPATDSSSLAWLTSNDDFFDFGCFTIPDALTDDPEAEMLAESFGLPAFAGLGKTVAMSMRRTDRESPQIILML